MKICNLSFGKIVILNKNLAEVIVDEGIIFDEVMVDEYHDFLSNNLYTPFSLLINKKHSYSYTFGAQKKIGHFDGIKAMAVIALTSGGVMSTETLVNINGNSKWNLKLFQEREQALVWLEEEMST